MSNRNYQDPAALFKAFCANDFAEPYESLGIFDSTISREALREILGGIPGSDVIEERFREVWDTFENIGSFDTMPSEDLASLYSLFLTNQLSAIHTALINDELPEDLLDAATLVLDAKLAVAASTPKFVFEACQGIGMLEMCLVELERHFISFRIASSEHEHSTCPADLKLAKLKAALEMLWGTSYVCWYVIAPALETPIDYSLFFDFYKAGGIATLHGNTFFVANVVAYRGYVRSRRSKPKGP